MSKTIRAVAGLSESFLVALTVEQCRAVSGGRWREEVAVVPPPPATPGGAAMINAWGIYDPGGVGIPPGAYGECYDSPTCHVV